MPLPVANIARFATTAAASVSVSKVLSEVIKNNVPDAANHLDSIQVKAGSAILSFVIAGAAARRAEELFDSVVAGVIQRQAEKAVVTE